MASLQAMVFNLLLKTTFRTIPLHIVDAKGLRDRVDSLAPKHPPADITVERIDGAVKGEWHRYRHAEHGRTILYCHGGGYKFGSPRSYAAFTYALAKEARANVFSLEYRMAPEHPFPAPVEDAVACWRWLMEQGVDPAQTIIGGDSAGGGLTLALLLSIKAGGMPMPAAALLLSPWTDMATTGESLTTNEHSDAMFKKTYIVEGAKIYLHGADPKNPLASPLYGDLVGLPPALIFASEDEILLADSTRLHDRLQQAGVESHLILEKGLAHVWPVFPGRFPEAMRGVRQAAEFIREKTPGGGL